MTTILTDGNYLIADHRVTETRGRNHRLVDLHRPASKRIGLLNDFRKKLQLFPESTIFRNPRNPKARAVAYGLAGGVREVDQVINLVESMTGCDVDARELISSIVTVCSPRVMISLIIVFDDHTSMKTSFMPVVSETKTTTEYGVAGKFMSTGSGSTIHRTLKSLLPKDITLEEMFILSAGSDRSTSPSYSVYGVKEKTLYMVVSPSPAEIKKKFKEIMTSRLQYDRLNIRNYVNSFEDV